ncbi:MAG TPA: hypothetical protein VHP54_02045, partial [Caproiciproducens sp.]|nr:hypothetical protein [Caproiciproducens sp.]
DERYNLVVSSMSELNNVYTAVKYCLITIFIRILALNESLPCKSNIYNFDKTQRGNIKNLLSDIPISSTSQVIIRESFNKFSEEKLVAKFLQKGIWEDSKIENIMIINDLSELKNAFLESKEILKNNLYIDAKSIRQVLPIDLEQISSFDSVFVKKEGNED